MAISFNRLGKLGRAINNISSFQATLQTTLIDGSQGIFPQYSTEPDLAAVIGDNWISLLGSLESPGAIMQQLAQQTINRMVYRDQPQLNQTLTSTNLLSSIAYVLQQMANQGATILKQNVTATSNAFVGTGTGAVTVSTVRPFDGRTLENAYTEVLTFVCTSDSYIGGATAFNEGFSVNGEGIETDFFAFDWPLGSNAQIGLNAIDGDTSQGSNNLLNNSGFATFVSNLPQFWTLIVGTAGTNIVPNSSISYTGPNSMQWIGDGSTNIGIKQFFNNSLGNNTTLTPQTQYSVNLWLRTGGSAPSTGILQVSLVNEATGLILNDQAGTPNSFTVDLTTLNTTWRAFNGFFRTPENTPANLSIRYQLTTPLNNGATVYFAKTSMGNMAQAYLQGPFVALHSGNTPFVQSPIADFATANVTNSRGAGGTLNTWQTVLFRLLSSAVGVELIWPSSVSPNVSDGLLS